MATRFRKSRRQRGSRYCGWGQVGQHRQAGSGGGGGGGGKNNILSMGAVIEGAKHIWKDTF